MEKEKIQSKTSQFFYKYWWLFYLLIFILIGLLFFVGCNPKNTSDLSVVHTKLSTLEDQIECGLKRKKTINERSEDERLRDAGGQIGCINATLYWNTEDDLDLHSIDPFDNHIYYSNFCKRRDGFFSRAGGQIDVDMNAGGNGSTEPVENIYYKCTPPNGSYKFFVHCFAKTSQNREIPYTMKIRVDGEVIQEFQGVFTTQKETHYLYKLDY
jgi:hypothetical protein